MWVFILSDTNKRIGQKAHVVHLLFIFAKRPAGVATIITDMMFHRYLNKKAENAVVEKYTLHNICCGSLLVSLNLFQIFQLSTSLLQTINNFYTLKESGDAAVFGNKDQQYVDCMAFEIFCVHLIIGYLMEMFTLIASTTFTIYNTLL